MYDLEKALKLYMTKEEYHLDTKNIVRMSKIDEIEDNIKNLQKINVTNNDTLNEKYT